MADGAAHHRRAVTRAYVARYAQVSSAVVSCLRRRHGEAAGAESDSSSIERTAVNTGATHWSSHPSAQASAEAIQLSFSCIDMPGLSKAADTPAAT
jgi:hypothetical protein